MPVFSVHSWTELRVGGRLDGKRYFATYRMLAVFLVLADEALARGAGVAVMRAALAAVVFSALAGSAGAVPECAPATEAVRVMLHDPEVLAARLSLLAKAPGRQTGRVEPLRQLFTAAGCQQISERGDEHGRNVECLVPGSGDGVIVVGASQQFDSLPTLALLPSLAEALAAAPRKHTFRWVAFSAHTATQNGQRAPKPKGAMRLWKELPPAERQKVHAMIHLGPLGFGGLREHPDGAEIGLHCSLKEAARVAGLELGVKLPNGSDCRVKRNAGPGSRLPSLGRGPDPSTTGSMITCRPENAWEGGADWQPFRRAGIPVFGVHSQDLRRPTADFDAEQYLKSYRALVVFLALADEALSEPKAEAEAPAAADR